MANSDKTIIDIRLDTIDLRYALARVHTKLNEVSDMTENVKGTVTDEHKETRTAIDSLKQELSLFDENMGTTAKTISIALSTATREIMEQLRTIAKNTEPSISGEISNIVSIITGGMDIRDKFDKTGTDNTHTKTSGKGLSDNGTGKASDSITPNSANASSEDSLANHLIGSVGSSMDFGVSMDEMAKSIGNVVTKLKENAAAWWATTGAKTASTVAEWAQIAATTAWQAICTAATAVTTAFGAAISFLTSPIGLVILAIAAVIAIVVLLVKNWDTVSAKAKEVWGFVQEKFAALC